MLNTKMTQAELSDVCSLLVFCVLVLFFLCDCARTEIEEITDGAQLKMVCGLTVSQFQL